MKFLKIISIITSIVILGFISCKKLDSVEEHTYYEVSFDTKGGEPRIPTKKIKEGDTLSKSSIEDEEPKKDNMPFLYWSIGDNMYDFKTPITKDIKLTAKYTLDITGYWQFEDTDEVDNYIIFTDTTAYWITESYSDSPFGGSNGLEKNTNEFFNTPYKIKEDKDGNYYFSIPPTNYDVSRKTEINEYTKVKTEILMINSKECKVISKDKIEELNKFIEDNNS